MLQYLAVNWLRFWRWLDDGIGPPNRDSDEDWDPWDQV